jgi:hypothetical protein
LLGTTGAFGLLVYADQFNVIVTIVGGIGRQSLTSHRPTVKFTLPLGALVRPSVSVVVAKQV